MHSSSSDSLSSVTRGSNLHAPCPKHHRTHTPHAHLLHTPLRLQRPQPKLSMQLLSHSPYAGLLLYRMHRRRSRKLQRWQRRFLRLLLPLFLTRLYPHHFLCEPLALTVSHMVGTVRT
jgi:hypothetical protein